VQPGATKTAARPGPHAAPGPKASLNGLAALRDALGAELEQRAREREAAARREHEAALEADLFRQAIGAVEPLRSVPRSAPVRPRPLPVPLQTRRDEQAVLVEAISDDFDPDALLDIDETLSYCRPGVARDVARKLRRGTWIIQAQLDLHGMRREQARLELAEFLRDAVKRGLRCVRVIHGKGLGSVGKEPVLKGKVRTWLVQKQEVIAFCQARPHDGGAGAVLVLLQPEARGQANRPQSRP
jgi:DNA-nicking Smr family endonuclease